MKKVKIGQEMHFEFKGTLGEFLDKIDEYFGLGDLSKRVNAVIDIEDKVSPSKNAGWIKVEDKLPVPTDGDDFLVKTRALETNYAYAWYAYDRQCFMDYADGLSLANAVTHWMPIEPPKED